MSCQRASCERFWFNALEHVTAKDVEVRLALEPHFKLTFASRGVAAFPPRVGGVASEPSISLNEGGTRAAHQADQWVIPYSK